MSNYKITPPQGYIDYFVSLPKNAQNSRLRFALQQLTYLIHLAECGLKNEKPIFTTNLYTWLIGNGMVAQNEQGDFFITPHGKEFLVLVCTYCDGMIEH